MSAPLHEAYDLLHAAFGPQSWWPGETPLEVLVGAVLVQNTAWKNVERAIDNLREAGALSLDGLHGLAQEELEELIRPAGCYRVKARRLRNVIDFIHERYEGSLERMFAAGLLSLREQLLEIHGIGPETADSILLYAGGLATFVVDAYTVRVLARHGWIDSEADYHAVQEEFQRQLPDDPALFNEYHALLVEVGKRHCKKSAALCAGCPLEPLLPAGGPRAPEW